jgi:hypothetical protein
MCESDPAATYRGKMPLLLRNGFPWKLLLRIPKWQRRIGFDFFQYDVRSNLGYAGQFKYEVIEKRVVGINVFDDNTQVKVGFATGREALENLRMPQYFANKAFDVLLFVTCERHMHDRRQAESRFARINDCGVTIDGAGFFKAFDSAPASRTRHPDPFAKFLHGQTSVALQFVEDSLVFGLKHSFPQENQFFE